MDEALEVTELLADSGLEGAFVWLLRILGIVAVLAGLGLWLFMEVGILLPAVLIVVGIALIVLPGILLGLAESFV